MLAKEILFDTREFIVFLKSVWEQFFVAEAVGRVWINVAGSIFIVTAFIMLAAYGNKYEKLQMHQRKFRKPSKFAKGLDEKALRNTSRNGLMWFFSLVSLGLIVFVSQGHVISLFVSVIMVLAYLVSIMVGLAMGLFVVFMVLLGLFKIYEKYLEDTVDWFIKGIKISLSWFKPTKKKVAKKITTK
jgi:hypothetical protein